jgi:transcriptional regulator with XRE-family HTH domain
MGTLVASEVVVAAQVRAARALLNWSQAELAAAAGVGVTTVRDIESERRPADTGAMRELRRVLENEGVILVPGSASGGPGVRFVAGRPHVTRQPVMTIYDGLHFGAEWQGREITVFVPYEVVQDLGGFTGRQADVVYQRLFADWRGKILDRTATALHAGRIDRHERVRLGTEDFPELVPGLSIST